MRNVFLNDTKFNKNSMTCNKCRIHNLKQNNTCSGTEALWHWRLEVDIWSSSSFPGRLFWNENIKCPMVCDISALHSAINSDYPLSLINTHTRTHTHTHTHTHTDKYIISIYLFVLKWNQPSALAEHIKMVRVNQKCQTWATKCAWKHKNVELESGYHSLLICRNVRFH